MEHLLGETTQFHFDDALRTRWLGFDHSAHKPTSFHDYPTERGWDKTRLLSGDLSSAHPNQASKTPEDMASSAAAMVQSWLYFGVLEEVAGERVAIEMFVSTDIGADGFRTLHSTNLLHVLKMSNPIAGFLEHRNRGGATGLFDNLAQTMMDAKTVCVELQRFNLEPSMEYPLWSPLLDSILPSIILMLEAVEGVAKTFVPSHPQLSFDHIHFPPVAHKNRLERLINLGWCPFTIDILRKTTNNSVLSWIDAAQFKREPNRHLECDPSQCRLYQIDAATYKTKHVSEDCKCEFQNPNLEVIEFALSRGKIPAITVIDDSELRLDVTTFDSAKRGSYLAFSHVWADGLGSVSEKGLPSCQIRRLAKIASSMLRHDHPCFWIDSLCVPERKDLRKKAIILMAKTYASAAAVIVLDKDIQNISIRSPSEEVFLTIFGSGWMGRLWTYQEAALARKLVFQMKEGRYELDPNQLPSATVPLTTIWIHLARQLEKLTTKPKDQTPLISFAQTTLRWRSTTKSEDETLAIAGILGIDASVLLQYDGEERKAVFWKLLKSVPKGVIHLPGLKLRLNGFRWAPRTLLYQHLDGSNTMIWFKDGVAQCTDHGLVGNFEALILSKHYAAKPEQPIYLHEEESYSIYQITGLGDEDIQFVFNAVVLAGQSWGEFRGSARIATAIHMKASPLSDDFEYTGECTRRLAVRKVEETTLHDCKSCARATVQCIRLRLT